MGFLADNGRLSKPVPRSIDGRATNRDDPLVTVNIVYRRKVIASRMIDKEWTTLPLLPCIYIYMEKLARERVVIQREKEKKKKEIHRVIIY